MSRAAFDKRIFDKVLNVCALRVPVKRCSEFMKTLRGSLLNYPRQRNIVTDEASADSSHKLLLLSEKLSSPADLPAAEAQFVRAEGATDTTFRLELDYSYWSADECFQRLLPADVEAPASFETIGHIAHLNLRGPHEPFKHIIGEVILDKNPGIRTVVNKVGTIATEFRTFQMEVLAGERDLNVEVKESKSTFRFNFADVYWNSRLQQEHIRLVKKFAPTDVLCDMFCGVGPFAVPAARQGCTVYANDLNPKSHQYLVENVRLNKVGGRVTCFNLDARAFVRQLLDEGKTFTQVVMNLPADAIEFLDVFRGRFDGWRAKGIALPTVHCYCFSAKANPRDDVFERVDAALGVPLDRSTATIRQVRDVAPKKLMMCISFPLPQNCAFSDSASTGSAGSKRPHEALEKSSGSAGSSAGASDEACKKTKTMAMAGAGASNSGTTSTS
eukprot:g4686.t1